MSEEKRTTVDIPESIEGYTVTLFWGLTITQIVLVFFATLFVGFGIFSLVLKHFLTMTLMLVMTGLMLLGIVQIRGRNFYRHILFILSYYQNKPRVLIYNHYATSGVAALQAKQLVYQRESQTKTLIMIVGALIFGVVLLILVAIYLYHVLHS
jgi:hypothetical protein